MSSIDKYYVFLKYKMYNFMLELIGRTKPLFDKDVKGRNKFLEYINANGVMTRPIWELMNRLPMFKDCQIADLSNSEWLADGIVNIRKYNIQQYRNRF